MCRRRAFTLLELLVVVAILGVLVSLGFAAGAAARARMQTTRCLADMRQIGAAALLHVNDHRGLLPSLSHARGENGESRSWTVTLRGYLTPDFIGRCPARPGHVHPVTYGWNDLLAPPPAYLGLPYTACRTPSATVLLVETPDAYTAEHIHFFGASRGVTAAYFRNNVRVDAHGASANYLFVDGHVRTLPWADVQRRFTTLPSSFVNP